MIDYEKLIESLNSILNDAILSLIPYAHEDTDFEHGKRIGEAAGLKKVISMLEELRMSEFK